MAGLDLGTLAIALRTDSEAYVRFTLPSGADLVEPSPEN